jgi:hypothetical protein
MAYSAPVCASASRSIWRVLAWRSIVRVFVREGIAGFDMMPFEQSQPLIAPRRKAQKFGAIE